MQYTTLQSYAQTTQRQKNSTLKYSGLLHLQNTIGVKESHTNLIWRWAIGTALSYFPFHDHRNVCPGQKHVAFVILHSKSTT